MLFQRIAAVLRDRRRKEAMAEASYWDERARTRNGYARSVWHSETFSRAWDARQRAILRDAIGTFRGLAIADVGCGTGRITRFVAEEGARAVGFDFSAATVEAARAETADAKLSAEFVVADVTSGQLGRTDEFDVVLAVGCLAVACRDRDALVRALSAMRAATKPGGRVVLLEPIHTTRFFGRVLREGVEGWIDAATRAGLAIEKHAKMGFLPARLALSSVDLPAWIVEPAFAFGEIALDVVPALERAADYRLLVFRRAR